MATRKRPSRSKGIGRGHGAGSRVSQFQPGEPSRNPHGRPAKTKKPISLDLQAALRAALARRVPLTRDGVTSMATQLEGMAELMVASFQGANVRDRASFLRFLMEHVLPTESERSYDIPIESIAAFVRELAAETGLVEVDGGYEDPSRLIR